MGGLAVTLFPVNKHQATGTQSNTNRGWLGFLFLTSPSKKLCFILAWGQKATTPFCKHYKTISRPNLPWCFNQAAESYQVQVDAEGFCARMKCSRSSYTLWVVVTCHFSSWSYGWPRGGSKRGSGGREWSERKRERSRGRRDSGRR